MNSTARNLLGPFLFKIIEIECIEGFFNFFVWIEFELPIKSRVYGTFVPTADLINLVGGEPDFEITPQAQCLWDIPGGQSFFEGFCFTLRITFHGDYRLYLVLSSAV